MCDRQWPKVCTIGNSNVDKTSETQPEEHGHHLGESQGTAEANRESVRLAHSSMLVDNPARFMP